MKVRVKCKLCGAERTEFQSRARPFCDKFCYGRWQSENRTGDKSHRWKGGLKLMHGYIVRRSGKRIKALHREIMEKHLGRSLRDNEVVHHRNEIKTDNRIENLQVMTNSEHIAFHRSLDGINPQKSAKISRSVALRLGEEIE